MLTIDANSGIFLKPKNIDVIYFVFFVKIQNCIFIIKDSLLKKKEMSLKQEVMKIWDWVSILRHRSLTHPLHLQAFAEEIKIKVGRREKRSKIYLNVI